MHVISLPLIVPVGKNKKFSLNLNEYRNAHFHTLNKAKKVFQDMVSKPVRDLPIMGKIKMTYVLFPRTKRELDVANICAIVDKFFADTMVAEGRIIDDNFKILPSVSYKFGDIDKLNPRVEVRIEPLDQDAPMETEMQITLNQDEILTAIETYVRSQINIADNQEIAIDLKAGRGENGYTATLDIRPASAGVKIAKPTVHEVAARNIQSITPSNEAETTEPEPEEAEADETEPVAPEAVESAEETPDEQPEEKPTSIFNFNNKNAG